MNKKMRKHIIAFMGACILLLCFCSTPMITYANSAAPIRPDSSSGIVFKEHEHIQIKSEVLSIQINNGATANIKAQYIMKNVTDKAHNVETMFISPVEYGEDKDISIRKNNSELPFTQEFYAPFTYRNYDVDIDDWEGILGGIKDQAQPFGTGNDFFEYRIQGSNSFYARFLPTTTYFYSSHSFSASNKNYVELSSYYNDIIIISKQGLSIETNGYLIKTQINDIYEYLFNNATAYADDIQLRFARQQFNLYLHNINANTLGYELFQLEYIDQYVSAITYFIDFEPNEELELVVSYVYQMGTSGYSNTAQLRYFLSPAKYWNGSATIEINLFLSEKYKKLSSSSLKFSKVNDGHYQFTAKSLPDLELELTVSDGAIFTPQLLFILIFFLICALVILVPSALIIVVIVMVIVKNKQNNSNIRG